MKPVWNLQNFDNLQFICKNCSKDIPTIGVKYEKR